MIFTRTKKVTEKVGKSLTKNQKLIIKNIVENPNISARDLSDIIGISQRKIGPAKGGYWEVIKK